MKKSILVYILLAFLFACSDKEAEDLQNLDKSDVVLGTVSLKLDITNPTTNLITSTKTSAKINPEKVINDLWAVTYKSDGSLSEIINITSGLGIEETVGTAIKRPVSFTLSQPMTSLHIAANLLSIYTTEAALKTALASTTFDELFVSGVLESPFIMWGTATASQLASTNEVLLYHNVAKTTVELGTDVKDFAILGLKLISSSSVGSIAPSGYVLNTLTEESGETYANVVDLSWEDGDTALTLPSAPMYFYETSKSANSIMVLEATYKGSKGYYSFYYKNESGEKMDLLRNHYYKVVITAVTSKGYQSAEEAISNPSNNIVVDILDYSQSEDIKDFVFNNSYALGLKDSVVTVNASATSLKFKVVTSYNAEDAKKCIATILTGDDWIESITPLTYTPISYTFGSITTAATMIEFDIKMKANNMSDQAREGTINFLSGSLEREMRLIQQGADLKIESGLTVTIFDNGVNKGDYWEYLKNIKGLTPKDMNGTIRNEGLHFNIMNNKLSYRIKHGTGDIFIPGKNASYFTKVDDVALSEWIITCADNAPATSPWIGDFSVKTSTGLTVNYDVYRTGVIHNEKGTTNFNGEEVSDQSNQSEKVTGLFYYEAVDIGGRLWLDRNLGGSSNSYYSYATNMHSGQDINSIGGYYKIGQRKLTPKIFTLNPCPDGFRVPTVAEFTSLGIKINHRVSPEGEEYKRAEVVPTASLLKENIVYFPSAKFRENDNLQGFAGGYYWTSTEVSGNQGFDEGSKEYGYWYRYLNIVGENRNYSNARFVNGGNGVLGTIYKGMSVRCIKKNLSEP